MKYKPEKEDNKFENSHIIGFGLGIIYLGLTPEYVDSHDNIITAHKKICNSKAELGLIGSCRELKNKGIKSIPTYLPQFVRDVWDLA